ncbi:MAG: winged helix DNA-binding domain-containing protein, partial [Hyphomonadaceae bacterium]|nr:winged helix DNA-binding domain-containing protein [Hyphomonadaceae bacterium]
MSKRALTLQTLRRYAVARTLFPPTTLAKAIDKLGFVQADPIRAPARAQDLTLRHRVRSYRAGELERAYPNLAIEEDFFVNYGFLPRSTHALMHPRTPRKRWSKARQEKANAVLEFVRAQGVAHPRDVDAHFQHGKVRNWFGGSSNASTKLLDEMHYRGLVRIAGRAQGIRLYAPREVMPAPVDPQVAMDTLVDLIVRKYAPLPERSLADLVRLLRSGVPQWALEYRTALERARARLPSAEVEGVRWFWPAGENPLAPKWTSSGEAGDTARLLAPFDPVVWDRRRFELLWNWSYRFEAYTPAAKRVRGYYALPLLWRDAVIGWGNLSVVDNRL